MISSSCVVNAFLPPASTGEMHSLSERMQSEGSHLPSFESIKSLGKNVPHLQAPQPIPVPLERTESSQVCSISNANGELLNCELSDLSQILSLNPGATVVFASNLDLACNSSSCSSSSMFESYSSSTSCSLEASGLFSIANGELAFLHAAQVPNCDCHQCDLCRSRPDEDETEDMDEPHIADTKATRRSKKEYTNLGAVELDESLYYPQLFSLANISEQQQQSQQNQLSDRANYLQIVHAVAPKPTDNCTPVEQASSVTALSFIPNQSNHSNHSNHPNQANSTPEYRTSVQRTLPGQEYVAKKSTVPDVGVGVRVTTTTASQGELCFICEYKSCGKGFCSAHRLRRHQLIHSGVCPFKCRWPRCDYASSQKAMVTRHIRTQHFGLPKTQREQRKKKIEDDRNPYDYVEVRDE